MVGIGSGIKKTTTLPVAGGNPGAPAQRQLGLHKPLITARK
jgi:hypothetical protein